MSPQVQRPLPPYQQITQHFRDLIRSGELRDGDRLPSARQLVEQWGVAHATAAKVLATLRAEGLVKTTSGGAGGTVVNVQDVGRSPRDRALSARRRGRIYPPGEHARIVSAELVDAPEHVAAALGVESGSPVIRRHRVTYREEIPVSASTSWYPGALAEVAPGLLSTDRLKQGTPGYIEQQTGRVARHGRDQFTAALADAAVAADLGVGEGSPVLFGRNWFRDGDDEVLEYGEYVCTPERWQTYEYELD
ncbi:GntR family transcriptional regulator [Plantactinospora mayteni]|uniref:GntR family transcriptional regulator n=1 Tax=Plantactinospora mayteni TaxID=566021 RepID=A0ABQ4F461_9ACTN|nr:GntR family transcriptional regulator [Plantactinospora mayteni]GIH01687.1 GntR family transcriptional regulator [Plantactinospora mayteni]